MVWSISPFWQLASVLEAGQQGFYPKKEKHSYI